MADAPRITDRRASARASGLIVPTAAQATAALQGRLPRDGVAVPGLGDTNRLSQQGRGSHDELTEMRLNRRVALKKQSAATSGADVMMATGRPRDPMFYWRNNNVPYDVTRDDELKKIRAFCNTPDAPIWMGDYSFKPIGEVQRGDEIIGWIYSTGEGGQQRKKLVRTKVLATKRRMAPEVVRITMESGRVVRCTPDHMWANYHYSPIQGEVLDRRIVKATGQPRNKPITWQQPEYKPAAVGGHLTSFIEPTEPLEGEKERLVAAWLSGIYDGEGSGNEIGQSRSYNPDVYRRIQENLDLLGIPHRDMEDRIRIQTHIGIGVGKRGKAGGQQALVDFLNWTNPVRRVKAHTDRQLLTRPSGGKDKIVSIESEGPGEVVSMQTETGNYVAWGYASRNCRLLYLTHPVIAGCIDVFSKWSVRPSRWALEREPRGLGRRRTAQPRRRGDREVAVPQGAALPDPAAGDAAQGAAGAPPRWEYDALMRSYPELQAYASENALMPVSTSCSSS
jgi:hypothetical protein